MPYKTIRHNYPESAEGRCSISFSSKRKRMSTLVAWKQGGYRLFCKGASEMVMGLCSQYMDQSGNMRPMDQAMVAELDKVSVRTCACMQGSLCAVLCACWSAPLVWIFDLKCDLFRKAQSCAGYTKCLLHRLSYCLENACTLEAERVTCISVGYCSHATCICLHVCLCTLVCKEMNEKEGVAGLAPSRG
jgi:hypothetical protein